MATQGERRAATRQRLLDAAAELFATRGIEASSVDAIAERAERTSGAIYDHFGGKPLQVVSGYRNQRKLSSNHTKGTASDIRIAGVSIKQIRDFADTLDRGGMGIGIYPRSLFVHVDVRSPPSYRWTDYSPPNPDAAEKRPPRGWKRKKLQS